MLKVRLFVAVLIWVLLFSGVGMLSCIDLASAEVEVYPWDIVMEAPPIVTINTPVNGTLLYANSIILNFTVTKPYLWVSGPTTTQMLKSLGYVIDNKSYGPFPAIGDLSSPLNYCFNLTLDRGAHSLQAYANASGYIFHSAYGTTEEVPIAGLSKNIYFETLPAEPTVEVQPPTINGTSVRFNFTVDEPFTEISYSLDNSDNVSIAGNTTLTGLPYGNHNLTLYATNPVGNIGSSVVTNFKIEKPAMPFPTEIAAAVSASAAIAAIVVFLIMRRRRGMQGKKA